MDGLYLLWWVQEKQMSPALVAATIAAGDLLLMAIEIPTGWFADKFGNRRSLILGSFIQVAGMICCWLADGIPGLVLACLLVAVGDAFRSGADQALLYRSCVELDRESEFQKIEARSRAVHVIALAALTVAGGAVVTQWGFAVGWIAETLLCATGGVIAYAMIEPPTAATVGSDPSHVKSREGSGPARVPWTLAAAVILPLAFLDAMTSAGSFIMQTSSGSGPSEVTMFVASITLAGAAGSTLAMRLPSVGPRAQIALAAVGAGLAGVALTTPAMFVPITIVLSFATGVAHPLRATAIQRLASDSMRARAASVANACDMALSTVMLLITGSWIARR
jgi:hypothetical protein